jgi:hypothetical protein
MSADLINNLINIFEKKEYDKAIELCYSNINIIENIFNGCSSPIVKYPFSIKLLKKLCKIYPKKKDPNLDCTIIRQIILGLVLKNKMDMLNEAEEVPKPDSKKKYVLLVGNTPLKKQLFILYIVLFAFEVKNQKEIFYVGVDYEFTKRVIALMQLNFEAKTSKKIRTFSYLWIVNPGDFDKVQMSFLIQKLMVNQQITKILHGSDSLDYPYMFDIMFEQNKDLAKKFTKSFVDTRYLCEYFKISIEDYQKKCAIYEALLYFGTITDSKYKFLLDSHDNMGPVQDVQWDINKLSSFHTRYALYDVLFLKTFLIDIHKKALRETESVFPSYTYVTNLARFTFLEKKEITTLTKVSKQEIDPINNYLIRVNGVNHTLIGVYNKVIENMKLPELSLDINSILRINYIKSTLVIMFKRIVYSLLTRNFRINKNKKDRMETKLYNDSLYKELITNNLPIVLKVMREFEKEALAKIILNYK